MDNDDIVKGDFRCLRCGGILKEKRPKLDKHLVCQKEFTVRFWCPCGYYEDRVMKIEDFKLTIL